MARSLKKSPKMGFKKSLSRVRVRSQSLKTYPNFDSIERDQRTEFLGSSRSGEGGGDSGVENEVETSCNSSEIIEEVEGGNKIMVVIDPALESKGALEWALSHTIQSQDTVMLLCIDKPSRQGKKVERKQNQRANQLLHSLSNLCQTRRPGVQVEVRMVQGRDKGPLIVDEAKQQEATLLVIGHRKKPSVWRLFRRWPWKRSREMTCRGLVDYCIQNAACMTIAVRRKSSKLGGYLITTKRHKNFWLLA